MSNASGEIFVVDDAQEACAALLNNAGYFATIVTDEKLFVRTARTRMPACVVVSGESSFEILTNSMPKNFGSGADLSGRSGIPRAVEAMRNGAWDFIEKRLDAGIILDRVRTAIGRRGRNRRNDDCPNGVAVTSRL